MKKKVLICFSIIIAIILIALSIIIVARSSKKEKLVYITDSDYLYDIAIEYLKEKTREEVRKNYNEEYPVFCDYKGIAIAQSGSKKYVYMWILMEVHKSKSISLSGSSGPYKFTFENDKVVNYEIPKDGSLYSKSIKEMFPDDIVDKISEYSVSDEKIQQEMEEFFSSMQKIENFDFSFKTNSKKEINVIYDVDSNYDVVDFGGKSMVVVNGNEYSLSEVLKCGYIFIDSIIAKLQKDEEDGKCIADSYLDGGSREYNYDNMTVIVTKRLFEEKHEIIFAPTNSEINGVFNTYETLKQNQYTGSDYNDGIGISMYLKQIVNDNLWIVTEDKDTTAIFLIKIDSKTEVDSNIKEGDRVNIVFSGQYEDGYSYMELRGFGSENSDNIELIIYNDEEEAKEKGATFVVDEILGERCWIAHNESSSIGEEMVIVGEKYQLSGDSLQVGSRFRPGGIIGGSNRYLKDVTKIEKAK